MLKIDSEILLRRAYAVLEKSMQESVRILIVDDDAELRTLLTKRLADYGYASFAVGNGEDMFEALSQAHYDLILLDVMMPGEDGLGLCRRLRAPDGAYGSVPIIFLTALGEPADRIVGLELGADDYLPKPFQTRELIARIRAVLRRTEKAQRQETVQAAITGQTEETHMESKPLWRFGNWRLNLFARHLVDDKGTAVPLSAAEYRLLLLFLEHPQQVLSREQILEHTAGRKADVYDRSIDVQVNRLRTKLRDTGRNPEIIRTMRGDGYMLALPVAKEMAL